MVMIGQIALTATMNESTFLILVYIFFAFYAINAAIVYYFRHTPVFMKRRPVLVMLNSLFLLNLSITSTIAFSVFVDSEKAFPNWLYLICGSLGYTLTQMNYCVRILNLVYEYCVNRLRITNQQGSIVKFSSLKKVEQFAFWYFSLFGLNRNQSKQKTIDPHTIQSKVNTKIQLLAQIPIPLISIIATFITSYLATSTLNPPDINLSVLYIPIIICNTVLLLAKAVMIFLILHVKDGLSIKQEYIACIAVNIATFIPYYAGNYIQIAPKSTGPAIYLVIFAVIVQLIDVWYPLFLLQQNKTNYTLLETTEGSKEAELIEFNLNGYKKVMGDPVLRQELMNLLASELCVENAYFIQDYTHSKETLASQLSMNQSEGSQVYTGTRLIVQGLYDKYIKEGSPFQLNITAIMIDRVKKGMDLTGDVSIECFNPVFVEVNALVYRNTFANYVKQQMKQRTTAQNINVV